MDRYAFYNFLGIEGFHVSWYGLLTIAGIVAGMVLALIRLHGRRLSAELLPDCLLVILPLGFLGARLYYVAFNWEIYAAHPEKILAIWEGGQALYGSMIGGVLGVCLFCLLRRFPVLLLTDLLFPTFLLGQIIGRWGNFINQEAFGQVVSNPAWQFFPVSVYIEELGQWRQATFFYESFWNLLVLALILFLEKRFPILVRRFGTVTSMYLIGYGTGRAWIEGMRADSLYLGELRISQLLSALFVLIGILWLVRLLKYGKDTAYHGRYQLALNNKNEEKKQDGK